MREVPARGRGRKGCEKVGHARLARRRARAAPQCRSGGRGSERRGVGGRRCGPCWGWRPCKSGASVWRSARSTWPSRRTGRSAGTTSRWLYGKPCRSRWCRNQNRALPFSAGTSMNRLTCTKSEMIQKKVMLNARARSRTHARMHEPTHAHAARQFVHAHTPIPHTLTHTLEHGTHIHTRTHTHTHTNTHSMKKSLK